MFGAKNTKEMKERQLNQKDVDFESTVEGAIKDKDVKKIRDILSE